MTVKVTPEQVSQITFRGLSLTRPWPLAFLVGDVPKRIENRSKKPPRSVVVDKAGVLPIRIALHAAKSYSEVWANRMRDIMGVAPPTDNRSPHSQIFATCLCYGFVREPLHLGEQAKWWIGPYAWLLSEFIVLDEPVECRGGQGLWTFNQDYRRPALGPLRAAYCRSRNALASNV